MTDVKNQQRIKSLHRAILIISGMALFAVIALPIWRIELIAPQYPEGLEMFIYSYKLGGQVEIINGLNHYIGMKVLKADDFIEFTVLPYIIAVYAVFFILTGLLARRKLVYLLLGAFILFGIVAMVDFYSWLYDYGHNLDPTAAIIVPGMAYQPPLIGFKQLLNFGAYSIPDIGGWLMLSGGILIGFVYVLQAGFLDRFIKRNYKLPVLIAAPLIFMMIFCAPVGPQTIKIHKDNCDHCKMTISEEHFAAELITEKGRVYMFDDITCLITFKNNNSDKPMKSAYVHYFLGNNELI